MEPKKLTGEELKKINDRFVALRKPIKAAKVAVIRRMTKKINGMKAKKSKNPEIEKKTQSLIDQIMDMKKFGTNKQCDKVSLFALKNKLELQQILSDSKIDNRTKAMARLVFFDFVKSGIDKFKKENPEYLTWLEQKQKTKSKSKKNKNDSDKSEDENENEAADKKKTKKGKSNKKKKRLAADGEEIEVPEAEKMKNGSSDESESEVDQESSEDDEDKGRNKGCEEENNKNNKRPAENEEVKASKAKKVKKTKQEDEVDQENSEDAEDQDDTNKNQDKPDCLIKKSITKSNKINKKKMTVEKTDDEDDNNNDDDDIEDKKRKEANKAKCRRVIDPFFVSDDSNPVYLDIPEAQDEQKEEEKDWDMPRKPRRNDCGDFGRGRRNDKSNSNGFNKVGKDRNKFSNKNNFPDSKFNNRRSNCNGSNFGNKSTDFKKGQNSLRQNKPENNAELHPSWAARKKQQDALKQGFQGKKIVFNNDD